MSTEFCRHIRTTGARCGSPALRGKALCYYHDRALAQHRNFRSASSFNRSAAESALMADYFGNEVPRPSLPPLEDRESIQLALSMILSALAQGQLDHKLATILLYGLQVASSNAKTIRPAEYAPVRETVLDDSGNELAPDEDPEEPEGPPRRKSFMELLMEQYEEEDRLNEINTLPESQVE